jgi:hypothetical protein
MWGWLKRVRGALGLGVVWAGGGAVIGGLVELALNLFPSLPLHFIDIWPAALAVPGFLGGVLFAAVLRIAAGRRRFDELSLPLFTLLGAVVGGLLGELMVSLGAVALVVFVTAPVGALGGFLTLGIARMAEGDDLIGAGEDVERAGLSAEEHRDLLG